MSKTPGPDTIGPATPPDQAAPGASQGLPPPPMATDHLVSEIGSLLQELEVAENGAAVAYDVTPLPVISEAVDDQLVRARLGIAAGLFVALQYKHEVTARHALRVALNSSTWALALGLSEAQRNTMEVAALLHDIGVTGVPDQILLKPDLLDCDEADVMVQSRQMSLEILRHCCASQEILDIVEHVGAWYDGTQAGYRLSGEQIPVTARIISIVEAFDTMVTARVYRPAISHERAITELFDCAGTQFDPELVNLFANFHSCDLSQLREKVTSQWLNTLDPELVNSHWQFNYLPSSKEGPSSDVLFQNKLLDNMYEQF